MKPWEEFAQASPQAKPWESFAPSEPAVTPKKFGAEAFQDTLKSELDNAGWGTRNIAGAGTALSNVVEGIKQIFGKGDEQAIQNNRTISNAAPVGSFVGNAGLLGLTAMVPGANTVAGSGLVGAASGLLQPTLGDESRLANVAIGTGTGLAGGALAKAVGSRSAPTVGDDVKLLRDNGISLTPGQNAGGMFKAIEDKLTSVPVVGDVINSARMQGIQDFNKAAISRAQLPGSQVTGTGRDAIAGLRSELGQAYDDVLARSSVDTLEPQFVQNIANLRSMVQNLPARERKAFDQIIDRELGQRLAPNGRLNAENLQAAKSGLGQEVDNFSTSSDAYQRQLGQALKQARREFEDLVSRSNPQNAADLKAIDSAYAVFKRLQRAASGLGAEGGVFTPAQLANAAKAMDKTKDKRAFSEGTALLQDLADAGKAVMPSKVPDSGTAGRLMGNMFSLSGLLNNAAGLAAAIPAYVAYSRPGAAVINSAVNNIGKPAIGSTMRVLSNPSVNTIGGLSLADLLRN